MTPTRADAEPVFKHRHLHGISALSPNDITQLLDTAEAFKEVSTRPVKKVPALRGKLVVNLFFESSTRTRSSFEIAEKRLTADTLNFSSSGSSVSKGETLLDTAKNLEAMAPDMIVIRHRFPGTSHFLARHLSSSMINAGDGAHEHPTQALLDALTIRERTKRFEGLRVVIVGDIAHSRVVGSNVRLLTKMGAHVTLCGPPTMMPRFIEEMGVRVERRIECALEGADVVMMLRIQFERQSAKTLPSAREYFKLYGLTEARVKLAKPSALIMHPGPINRGVEIAPEVADGPHSVILEQVANGVAVRMAVLYLLSGAQPPSEA